MIIIINVNDYHYLKCFLKNIMKILLKIYFGKNISDGEDPIGALHPKFVLDDFTDSLYASKSTIASGETCEENILNILRRMEFVDPRGNINICK